MDLSPPRPYSAEQRAKAKRDVLVFSIALIFVNLSNLRFDEFSLFGMSGTLDAPFWAYSLLWAVWAYFGYQHLVFNWGDFTNLQMWRRDYMLHRAKQQVLIEATGTARPVDFEAEPRIFWVTRDGADGKQTKSFMGSVPAERVPEWMRNKEDKQLAESWDDQVWVEISYNDMSSWGKEFDSGLHTKQQYFLAVWFPLIIMAVAMISGIFRWFGLTDVTNA